MNLLLNSNFFAEKDKNKNYFSIIFVIKKG